MLSEKLAALLKMVEHQVNNSSICEFSLLGTKSVGFMRELQEAKKMAVEMEKSVVPDRLQQPEIQDHDNVVTFNAWKSKRG